MARPHISVIPIRRDAPLSDVDELVADFAYTLWRSSAFLGGSPEAAFFTALRMVKGKSSAGPFLVQRQRPSGCPIIVMKIGSDRGSN